MDSLYHAWAVIFLLMALTVNSMVAEKKKGYKKNHCKKKNQ